MDPAIEATRAGYSETSFKGDIFSPLFPNRSLVVSVQFSCLIAHASNSYCCCFVNCQKLVRIVETLENRGYRSPLTKEEADLYERLVAILKRVRFPPIRYSYFFGRLRILINFSVLFAAKRT